MRKFLITSASGSGYEFAQKLAHDIKSELSRLGEVAHLADDVDVPEYMPSLVIAVGGDGTIMRAMKKYSLFDIPTFGINGGDIGFLSAAEGATWESAITRVISDDYVVEQRMALSVQVLSTHKTGVSEVFGPFANEVLLECVHAQADYRVTIGDVSHFGDVLRSQGILVATATGSTAQNVTEGGPILLPASRNVAVTPMKPALLNVRPLVAEELFQGDTITLRNCRSKNGYPVALWADGGCLVEDVTTCESVVITQSPKPLLLATFGGHAHAVALRTKKGFAR